MGNLRVWVDGQAGQCMGVHGDDDDDDDVVGGGGLKHQTRTPQMTRFKLTNPPPPNPVFNPEGTWHPAFI